MSTVYKHIDTFMIAYTHTNSGGVSWIKDIHWEMLRATGWFVKGQTAYKFFDDLHTASRDWEECTGLSAAEKGCSCCGNPHSFFQIPSDHPLWQEILVEIARE